MLSYNNVKLKNITYNDQKVKKWNHNGVRIYNAGNTVTYYVDTDVVYTEEVDSEASCLSPKTFTPTKSDWEFVGWRENNTASSEILIDKIMGDSPITLYAVFRQIVTVTYYNNSTTASAAKKDKYYNNGNVVNPSFTLTQATKSGWTARGWATGTTGDAIIVLKDGGTFERGSNYTLYGMYQQTITVSYAGNGSTSGSTVAQTGTRYYNSNGNVVNPKFTLSANGFAKTGYSFTKWALGSAAGTQYAAGASVTLSANTTFYAVWTSNAFYWIKNGVVQSGYPSEYVQNYLNYTPPALDKRLIAFNLVGAQEGNTRFQGSTASVNTKGNKYMEITFASTTGMNGVLDAFTIAGKNYNAQVGASKTITVDVSGYSSVSIYLDITAYAWGNHANIDISSIRFYS